MVFSSHTVVFHKGVHVSLRPVYVILAVNLKEELQGENS